MIHLGGWVGRCCAGARPDVPVAGATHGNGVCAGAPLATSGGGSTSGSDYAYSSYSGSASYSRSDGMTYALSGTVYPNGYQSASDTFQTALGVDAQGNWISTSGSGSVHQESGNACTYSGSGSLSSSSGSSGNVGYSWFDGTASEHGSQYDSQGQTQAWTLASGAWSASGSPQAWTSASGESAYNFSASGSAVASDGDGTLTSGFNEQVASDTLTQAGSASGSGTATYTRTESYASPSSSWSTSVEGTDGWSKPDWTAQNHVTGQDGNNDSYDAYQSAPGFASQTYYAGYGGQNLNGIGTPPSNADGGYGPDSFAGPDCESSQLSGAVVGCQLSVVSGQPSAVSGQRSAVGLQSFLLAGEGQGVRAFGAGIGAQAGIGDWGLGIGGGTSKWPLTLRERQGVRAVGSQWPEAVSVQQSAVGVQKAALATGYAPRPPPAANGRWAAARP